MNVHGYKTAGGKNLILAYINKLNEAEQTDGLSVIEKLEEEKFDELTIKPWQDKISEAYFYKHNQIFYVVADGDNMYLLHTCRKQKNKTEKNDGEIVKKSKKIRRRIK